MSEERRAQLPSRDRGNAVLLVLSAGALIVLDVAYLSVPTGLGALALALFIFFYLTTSNSYAGLYGFFIAELSPLGLRADLLTAGIYQLFCMLLLTAVIAPLPRVGKLRRYGSAMSLTLIIAGVALVLGRVLVTATSLSALQASSLVGIGILGAVTALVYVQRGTITSAQEA